MTIGQLAREAGIRPSAIRYYESLRLLPSPARRSGRRDYTDGAIAHLAIVQFALATGFTLRETRQLVSGFSAGTTAGARGRAPGGGQVEGKETLIAQAEAMKSLLKNISGCRCETLVQCGQALHRGRVKWARINRGQGSR